MFHLLAAKYHAFLTKIVKTNLHVI